MAELAQSLGYGQELDPMTLPTPDELGLIVFQSISASISDGPLDEIDWKTLDPKYKNWYIAAGTAVAERMFQYFEESPNIRIKHLEQELDKAREERFQAEMRAAAAITRLST